MYSIATGMQLYSLSYNTEKLLPGSELPLALWDDALLTRLAGEEHAAHGLCVLDPATGAHRPSSHGRTMAEWLSLRMFRQPWLIHTDTRRFDKDGYAPSASDAQGTITFSPAKAFRGGIHSGVMRQGLLLSIFLVADSLAYDGTNAVDLGHCELIEVNPPYNFKRTIDWRIVGEHGFYLTQSRRLGRHTAKALLLFY